MRLVEFKSYLADGREAHVLAKVLGRNHIEIESVSIGPVGDDRITPLGELSAADLLGLEDDAWDALYEEQERARESA